MRKHNANPLTISDQPLNPLTLSNDGELSLYFIGTGSAFAKTLNQNNIVLVKGDNHLLVDCGTKCSQSLHQVGLPMAAVKNFLITHSHADHIGGLEEVQLFARYVLNTKQNMIINEEYQDILWQQSLRGGSEHSESKKLGFEDLWEVQRPTLLKGMPRETWHTKIGDIDIKMPRTKHFPDDVDSWQDCAWSVGVIVDDRVLFTSDTRYDEDLIMSFDEKFDFDIIFHDCQLFTAGVHSSLEELKQLPAHIKAKTILMHYGDNWQDFIAEAKDAGFHSWAKQGHSYNFSAE